VEVRRLTSFERFICWRENFVFDSLIYLEPVERFKNRSNVMKFWSFEMNLNAAKHALIMQHILSGSHLMSDG